MTHLLPFPKQLDLETPLTQGNVVSPAVSLPRNSTTIRAIHRTHLGLTAHGNGRWYMSLERSSYCGCRAINSRWLG